MKKTLLLVFLTAFFLACSPPDAEAASVSLNGTVLSENIVLHRSTTYVPLRSVSMLLAPGAKIAWKDNCASVQTETLSISARPGSSYLEANGRMLYVPQGIKLVNGTTLVPVRVLAKAFGASVHWDGAAQNARITPGSGTILSGSQYYDPDALYWLSRIISAESRGEPLSGQIAVGNVILNRVSSSAYPSTIYEVIFDSKWGTQFEPVLNGTIYNEPTAQSILAAKLCLDGASVVQDSLYFFNPAIASSTWISKNCSYITTIGNHQFYA